MGGNRSSYFTSGSIFLAAFSTLWTVVCRGAYPFSPAIASIVCRCTPHSLANSTEVFLWRSSHFPNGVRYFPSPNIFLTSLTSMDKAGKFHTSSREIIHHNGQPATHLHVTHPHPAQGGAT